MRRTALAMTALAGLLIAAAPLIALAPKATKETGTPADHPAPDQSASLAMLTGHWRADMGGSILDEYWFPVEHHSTTGVLRWFDSRGTIRMHELLHIGPDPEKQITDETNDITGAGEPELRYEMRHFHKGMKPWDDEAEGPYPGVVTFPAPGTLRIACTDPDKTIDTITYEKTGPDTMRSTLEYRDDLGTKPIVIDFTRVE